MKKLNSTINRVLLFMMIVVIAACTSTRTQTSSSEDTANSVILVSEARAEEMVAVAAFKPAVVILAFEDIHFDFDKSLLKPEAQTILLRNMRNLKKNPQAKIRIAGYTSAAGTEKYNQGLSEKRANAVKKFLIGKGLTTPGRLSTIGYGEKNPAEHEVAPKKIYSKAAKANMRVLFEIIVK